MSIRFPTDILASLRQSLNLRSSSGDGSRPERAPLLASMSTSPSQISNPMRAGIAPPPHAVLKVATSITRTGPAVFTDIPDDSLANISSYLTLSEFYRLSLTCRKASELLNNGEAWTQLLSRDFGGPTIRTSMRQIASISWMRLQALTQSRRNIVLQRDREPPLAAPDAKQRYRNRVAEHKRSVENRIQAQQRRELLQAVTERSYVLRVALDILSYCMALGLPCILIGVWMLLLMLKLNGSLDIEWSTVWIPFWITVGITTLNCLVDIMLVHLGGSNDSVWHQQDDANNPFHLIGLLQKVTSSDSDCKTWTKAILIMSIAFLLFVVFPALTVAKLDGSLDASWAAVFSPMFISFGLWCFMPCTLASSGDDRLFTAMITLVLWIPLLATLILIAVRLDGADIKLALVFIPLWVLDVGMAIACLVFCIIACASRSERKEFCALAWLVLLLLGVGLASTLLGSITDGEGSINPTQVILPFLVGVGVLSIIACLLMCIALRKSRRDDFTEAWPYVLRCGCCRRSGNRTPAILPGART